MGKYSNTFDWVEFPEGRARFASEVRGWDELGHELFALELRGHEYFGEIKKSFLSNHNDYNIVIDAFGYGSKSAVGIGMPGGIGARDAFTPEEEVKARSLVVQLIQAGLSFENPPHALNQTDTSHFMGKIFFKDSWILIESNGSGDAQ